MFMLEPRRGRSWDWNYTQPMSGGKMAVVGVPTAAGGQGPAIARAPFALRAAADEMTGALAEGFTLVLGGDCTLAVGVLAGARTFLGKPVGLIYLDANADLNTPETSPSGYLDGMALALALGRGPWEVI